MDSTYEHAREAAKRGDTAEARRLADQYLSEHQDSVSGHSNYALLLADEFGEYEAAQDHYKKALDIDPDSASAHNNYALLLKNGLGEYEAARDHYEKALTIDPDSASTHNNYANLLAEEFGEYAAARNQFKKALDIDPDDHIAHDNYAALLKNEFGEYEAARDHYEKALDIDPDFASAHYNYTWHLAEQDNHVDARHHFRRAKTLGKEQFQSYETYEEWADGEREEVNSRDADDSSKASHEHQIDSGSDGANQESGTKPATSSLFSGTRTEGSTLSDDASSDLTYEEVSCEDHPIARTPNADLYQATAPIEGDTRTVALKEPRVFGDDEVESKFHTSSQLWHELDNHPHIVTVFDWDTEPVLWLAMEYVEGDDLGDRLGGDVDTVSLEEALWIGECVADALQHLHHRGVAHLDVKPSNILFDPNQDRWDTPKLTDLQLAKLLIRHSGSVDDFTPAYVAPEQVDSDAFGAADTRTDLYQLGVVLYELVVGDHPFPDRIGKTGSFAEGELARTPTRPSVAADRSIPSGLDDLLMSMLSPDSTDRPRTAREVDERLTTIRTGDESADSDVDPTATPQVYPPLKMAENLREARELSRDPVRMCRDRAQELHNYIQQERPIQSDQAYADLNNSLDDLVKSLDIAVSADVTELESELYNRIDSIAYRTERLFMRSSGGGSTLSSS